MPLGCSLVGGDGGCGGIPVNLQYFNAVGGGIGKLLRRCTNFPFLSKSERKGAKLVQICRIAVFEERR